MVEVGITLANTMKVWKNLFGNNDKIKSTEIWHDGKSLDVFINNLFEENIIETTRAFSQSDEWYERKGFKIYYFGGDATDKGYPQDYGILVHFGYRNLTWQLYIGSSGNNVWQRRFNPTQSMTWYKVGG